MSETISTRYAPGGVSVDVSELAPGSPVECLLVHVANAQIVLLPDEAHQVAISLVTPAQQIERRASGET